MGATAPLTELLHSRNEGVGYDGLPIESMQGLDINSSHPGSTYGHIGEHGGGSSAGGGGLEINANTPLPHQQLTNQPTGETGADYHEQGGSVPQPPNDNNQVAAWYDTDL